MPQVGFELTISAGERPKTYALDRATTGTGTPRIIQNTNKIRGQNFWMLNLGSPKVLNEQETLVQPNPVIMRSVYKTPRL